jgi:hypothetical protein
MPSDRSTAAQLAAIRRFSAEHPQSVLFDEPGGVLLDVYSGKALPLEGQTVEEVELKTNLETGKPYLLIRRSDGRQLALAEVGIAFAPDPRNTGPLQELPPAVCFRDFDTLLQRVKHQLYGHSDRPLGQDVVRLLTTCIAILDGARAQGFEVGREERELERHLSELEKRFPGTPTIP